MSVSGGFTMEGALKVALPGLAYDGPIPGIENVSIEVSGSATFDPFSIDEDVVAHTEIPPTSLPGIPLAAVGLPGSLVLTVGKGSFLDVTFRGECAAIEGSEIEYLGTLTRSGTLVIEPSVEIEVPLIGLQTFAIPAVSIDLALGEEALAMAANVETFGEPGNGDAAKVGRCGDGPGGSGAGGEGGSGASGSASGGSASGGSGQGGSGGGAPSCYDDSTILSPAFVDPVAHQGACSPTDLSSFETSCATQGFGSASCLDLLADSPECASCLGLGTSNLRQPALIISGNVALANFTTCEAIVQGKPDCANPTSTLLACALSTCGDCASEEREACLGHAASPPQICGEAFPVTASCESIFDTTSPECLTRVEIMRFLCGGS